MSLPKRALKVVQSEEISDLTLFLLRVVAGGLMVLNHGWNKFSNFAVMSEKFPDPLHLGSSQLSLALAVSGELIACSLIVVGLFTRIAAVPAFITMAVAALVQHHGDPLSDREPALLFAICFLVVLVKGPGRISLDAFFKRL